MLLKRQTIIVPTLWGWLILLAVLAGTLLFIGRTLYPFLALNNPITKADILIAEGWLPDYALEDAANRFQTTPYQALITTGSSLSHGSYLKEYRTYADLAKASLVQMKIPHQSIVTIATPKTLKDRTYASALEVSTWLQQHPYISSINLLTLGPHARRSYDLYRKALPESIALGIISIAPKEDYIAERWWTSSAGIKTVLIESIAFLYYNTLWSPETKLKTQ